MNESNDVSLLERRRVQRIVDMLRCRRCLSARHVSCNICDGFGSSVVRDAHAYDTVAHGDA